jgi:hypothetical protein
VADEQWLDLVLTREHVLTTRALLKTTRPRLRRVKGDLGHDAVASHEPQQISQQARSILASAYEIPVAAVAEHANILVSAAEPLDEVLAPICRALRSALLGGEPSPPWIDA